MATNFPTYPATSFEQAVDLAIFSSNQLGNVVNGDATTQVETLNGNIPSVRKALVDNFYFKQPIDWAAGQAETVFNQLRFFHNGILSGYYYAPTASTTNPVAMSNSPSGDSNWVLYSIQQQQVPSEVYPWLYETATGNETEISPPYVFDSAIVTINGVVQIPDVAYTIEDSKIVLKEPLGLDPSTGTPNLLFAYLGKVEAGSTDYVQNTVLASNIGSSLIGEVGSCAALRSLLPTRTNQKVDVKGYYVNSTLGGGKFYYVADSTKVDDGGTFFRVNAQGGWKRSSNEYATLNVTHFGAVMDGVTDDMPAFQRMHEWGRTIDKTKTPGIRIPAGTVALSSLDLGTTEIPCFKLKGPEVEFGTIPAVTIKPISATTTTPMFTFKARRMEVTGIAFDGTGTVQPFMVNTVTRGAYVRIKSFVSTSAGGRNFQVKDTLDSKIDQIYTYSNRAAFLWVTWSNESPGSWDHPTAIEITNCNFTSQKNEYAISAIRCTQSIMHNVWCDQCEWTFDVSQGGWTWDNVIIEGATNPVAAKYVKLTQTDTRFATGASIDYDASGYTSDMDDDGKIPTWVTNDFDQGRNSIQFTGSSFSQGISAGFYYSDLIMGNSTNGDVWFRAGRVVQQGRGRTAHLRFLGATGWDSTGANITVPTGTNFGGGQADVYIELKYPDVANSQAGQVHWFGQGNCPIREVRYVHNWRMIDVYIKISAYALSVAMFVEGNGDPRTKTGTPLYVVPDGTQMTQEQVDAVTNIQAAPARWAINKGSYNAAGIGMDLDSGKLLLNAAYADVAGTRFLNVSHYGVDYWVPMQTTNQCLKIPSYNYANLPTANNPNVKGIVICNDTTMTPRAQPLYSDGSYWYLLSDPSNTTWKPAS